jgi:hypothetical protein
MSWQPLRHHFIKAPGSPAGLMKVISSMERYCGISGWRIFPARNKLHRRWSRYALTPRLHAMLDDQYHEELFALRNLEREERAYSVSSRVVPERRRAEMLAIALRAVIDARKRSIRRSKLPQTE